MRKLPVIDRGAMSSINGDVNRNGITGKNGNKTGTKILILLRDENGKY